MEVREQKRHEIEARLTTMGDYIKMEYLTDCLKTPLDFDTKKFVLIKLAGIYELKKMYPEAARLYKSMADISSTTQGKINDYVKAGQFFVTAGKFEDADYTFGKALIIAEGMQKNVIKSSMKEAYKTQAKIYLQREKRKHAMDTYEKLLTMDLEATEKKEVQTQLVDLYQKLGRVRELINLKRNLGI